MCVLRYFGEVGEWVGWVGGASVTVRERPQQVSRQAVGERQTERESETDRQTDMKEGWE